MKKQAGFTLNELLIGIVVAGVLALACFAVYALIHFVCKFW
jgi:prepilin-type N-terminal cleavage/methylation domain-containing protein